MTTNRMEWNQVQAEEKEAIRARRKGLGDTRNEDALVGLAISGGGIRSATFALGVLEGLKHSGLLSKVDYLSTVSGGGYIGSWLSLNCKRFQERRSKVADSKEAWLDPSTDWKLSVDHLRRYSNYLSPRLGFFSADTWSMGAIWLRNTMLVQLTVILTIAVVLLVPRLLHPVFENWPKAGNWRWITIFLFVLGAVGIAANHLRLPSTRKISFLKSEAWLKGLVGAFVSLSAALVLKLFFGFEPFTNGKVPVKPAALIGFLLIVGGFCLLPMGVRVVKALWYGKTPAPTEINYTQSWVQGIVVIPMLAVGFLIAAILWEASKDGQLAGLATYSDFFKAAWQYWPFPLSIVFVSLFLFSFCSIRNWQDPRCWVAAVLAPLPAMIVLHAALSALMLLLHHWASKDQEGAWLAYIWTPSMILYLFSLSILMLIGMMGRQSSEGVREWWSRFGAWLGIYSFGWILVSAAALYGPFLGARLLLAGSWCFSIGSGWIVTTAAGLLAGGSSSTSNGSSKTTRVKVLEMVARVAPFVFVAGLLIVVSSLLHLFIFRNSESPLLKVEQQQHWALMEQAKVGEVTLLFAACLLTVLLLAARVDINEFGLNAFYRSRLARCYLGATRFGSGERHPQNFTGFDDDDDLPLASLPELRPASQDLGKLTGPLHIVNCALNLGGSKDLALHTRHSASFTLTPFCCGSSYLSRDQTGKTNQIGYVRTSTFGGKNGQPSLAQAISVSGAAASPNMGYHTSPIVAFLLTIFNVRLGWWFPNPKSKAVGSPSPWFSLFYLLKELFGGASDTSSYLAISDGGHFENLGAYELVRRKCKVVIISDAECDPSLSFGGLGTLIRMCEVDFEARITIDVSSIRTGESLWSNRRSAVGTIEYSDSTTGILIYLKASMTGQESTAVLQYRDSHPSFPHESTGNQFYTENQFESYRSLGRDIAMRTFEPVVDEKDFETLIDRLNDISFPALRDKNQFTRHSKHLVDLWTKLSQNEDLNILDREFVKCWPKKAEKNFRQGFYICSEMIQLMENVFLDLRLDETWEHPDNAGWRATFEQWSASQTMENTWALTSENYGLRFRHFCERRLKLPFSSKAATVSGR